MTNLVSHGTAVLQEVLDQITDSVTPFGDVVDNNQLINITRTHGFGYLTGVAATLIEGAGIRMTRQEGSVADWESDLIEVANSCILAVIAGRLVSAAAVQADEPADFPPIDGDDDSFGTLDETASNRVIDQLRAAGL